MHTIRKIIHIDMDAYFASVEQRDNPKLKNKPVIVGGDPYNRGVVATCSYEARKYGIHSAMSSKIAYNLCPQAIFIKPRIQVYHEISMQIRNIFKEYTDIIEPLSLDEAFLDVTHNKKGIIYATQIAKDIKEDISTKLNLTASAGVSYNKFLAKIASDYRKPNGLTIITPKKAQEFIDKLPINNFFGVGKVTEKKLKEIGIYTGEDLRRLSLKHLTILFKKRGYMLYDFARGIDRRLVEPNRARKSVSREVTFKEDIADDIDIIRDKLDKISKMVSERLIELGKSGKTITLKIKYDGFEQITRSITLEEFIYKYEIIRDNINKLLDKVKLEKKVRLLGVRVSNCMNINEEIPINISIFDEM